MINYAVEYEFSAAALILALLGLYASRKKYPALSNKWYICLLFCVLCSAVFHIAAIFAVNNPYALPLWLDYVTHMCYLLVYDLTSVSGFLYVTSILYKKPRRSDIIYAAIAASVFAVSLITTPFLRMIVYLDENRNYCHGPLFLMLPGISLGTLVYMMVLFFMNRRSITKFQRASVTIFAGITVIAVGIQLLFPFLVIGNFGLALAAVMFFFSLQNPDNLIDKRSDCYNSQAFYMNIEHLMDKKKPFELAAFRLEGLSYINELLSVRESDIVVRTLSARLKKSFGKISLYHLGSNRFAAFSDESHSADDLVRIIQKTFSEPVFINDIEASLTPYICTLHYPDFVSSAEDIRDAIEYTLRSVVNHEGTVAMADKSSIEAKKRENRILSIVRNAAARGGFEVYYQPIYDTKLKSFTSAEALIRLNDEELGFINPEEFIPLAESNGLIIEIGEFVFRRVCEFLKSGEPQRLGVRYIEVNLSVLQCVKDGLADEFTGIMREYGVAPESVNFEITETAGLADYDTLLKNMNQLIANKVSFSMDDYGTGFSTANYLISLPAEIVKIDKSILWPAMKDPEAMTILRHTVDMLISLKKKIVVEGVETAEMVRLLTDMGVDHLQGYYFSKPVPADAYIKFLSENQP